MKSMYSGLCLVLVCAVLLSGCGKKKVEEKAPARDSAATTALSVQETNLADLMKHYSKAVVSPQPWIGYWWAYVGAGIAATHYDANGMSPADKYDAAYVSYLKSKGVDTASYEPMSWWERGRHGPGLANVASWWGHCNGWASSAIMVPEPTAPKEINGITFNIRDQKALLSESWMEFSGDFVGSRVDDPGDFSSAAFWDVAPAQFHLMLTNIVARQNRALILDRHTGHEIWNQPLVAFMIEPITKDDYLGAHPSYPDVYRVSVAARIWWANDNVGPDEVSPGFDFAALKDQYYDNYYPGRRLRYELWLDGPVVFDAAGEIEKSGNILVTRENDRYVGGVWMNGTSPAALIHTHPDYMWVPFGVQHSTGYKNPRIDDAWIRDNIGAPRGGL